jgi:cytochrome c oxidase subunit 4
MMAGTNKPGEPHESRPKSVAHDAHDALSFHRPPHLESDDPHRAGDTLAVTHDSHDHPGESVYIRVALILAIVTAIEVVIYYIEALEDILVPALLLLSAGKFIAVVGYFMHLKFDDRRFTWVFVSGLVIALSVFLGTAAMFIYHNYDILELDLGIPAE